MALLDTKTTKFPKIDRRYIWIGIGILTLLLNALFRTNPYFTEVVYSRGIFLLIRWVWDYSLGLIPIPLLYLFIPLVLFWLIRRWRRGKSYRQSQPLKNRIASLSISGLAILSMALFFFYFLWGFNYNRLPVAQQLKISPKALTDEEVKQEFIRASKQLIHADSSWLKDMSTAYESIQLPKPPPGQIASYDSLTLVRHFRKRDSIMEKFSLKGDLEKHIRKNLIDQLSFHEYPVPGRPRVRMIKPNGLLMQLGAIGIYFPFVAEGNVDAALTDQAKPHTMAHELAHAYGFGDEGTCNFWAYLACINSDNPRIQYSGYLNYWRRVASLYRRVDPEAFQKAIQDFPPYIINDLKKMQEVSKKYPGFFPRFYAGFYENYLKAQGIPEGRKSYSKVVSYVVAYTARQKALREG